MIEPIRSDRWIEQYVSDVFSTCRRNTPSDDAAWEAFQETFLAYLRRKNSLDLETDPGPWLKETARRCCLATVRRQNRLLSSGIEDVETELPASKENPTDKVFLAEATTILQEELLQMSEFDRKLLQLIYVEGITHREAAQQLNCRPGSVHGKTADARRQLQQRLKRRGIAAGLLLLLFLLQAQAEASSTSPVAPPVSASVKPTRIGLRGFWWQSIAVVAVTLIAATIYGDVRWPLALTSGLGITADTAQDSENCDSSCCR